MGPTEQRFYKQQTVFDRFGEWALRRVRRQLGTPALLSWSPLFSALAGLYLACAGALILIGLMGASDGRQRAAVVVGACLLGAVSGAFARLGRGRSRQARSPRRTIRPQATAGQKVPNSGATRSGRDPTAFLAELRAAGIDIRIAQVLYQTGFRSGSQIRRRSDRRLLVLRGVGPATVRKLRAYFGPHQPRKALSAQE